MKSNKINKKKYSVKGKKMNGKRTKIKYSKGR